MCLYVDLEKTNDYKQLLKENKQISVYKTFRINRDRLTSVHRDTVYYSGTNTPELSMNNQIQVSNIIYGGVLHAYQKRKTADEKVRECVRSAQIYNEKPDEEIVVRFIGKVKDFVACGDKDICFKELTLDTREEKRLKEWAKKNNRALYLNRTPAKKNSKKGK